LSYLLIYLDRTIGSELKIFPAHIKNILVPHAGTTLGDKALSYAIKIAKFSGATVNILHVVEPLPDLFPIVFSKKEILQMHAELGQTTQALVEDIKEELKKRVDFCKSKGINANHIVIKGKPEDAIINYAKAHHVDLIVMAKRRKVPGIRGMLKLGSVSRKILEISDRPILIVE
jgi:nucleotide-binding universal stress UspA family protein